MLSASVTNHPRVNRRFSLALQRDFSFSEALVLPIKMLLGGNPMTDVQIARIGPEFSTYLARYRCCFHQDRTAAHFDNYCRGLLSDLPRKSVEPIALESGTAVRTLQEFLTTTKWDENRARELHQQGVVGNLDQFPTNALGRVGVIDETSAVKKGDKTPGVQRQYCGAVGKIENCIVTVHLAVVQGRYKTLLDADLFLPESWDADRKRCEEAGIPDTIIYRPKWRIAVEQLARASSNGLKFDWLTFDEGYTSKVPFLRLLNLAEKRFVGEVPKSFVVRSSLTAVPRRADERLPATQTKSWRRFRLARETLGHQVWRAKMVRVWVAGRQHRLITAINEATGEVKYFLTNALQNGLARLLRVAFTRWNVEHVFRVAKQEVGLMHFEGRDYQGLMRHMILGLIVMGFVSRQAARLRGEKSTDHSGTDLQGTERPMCGPVATPKGNIGDETCWPCDPIPSMA
jgi:SRSO17 transposase